MADGAGMDALSFEQSTLFSQKFDRSHWALWIDVDLALREVHIRLRGHGGPDGELVATEEALHVPTAGWSEAFYDATSRLWSLLEVQLEADH